MHMQTRSYAPSHTRIYAIQYFYLVKYYELMHFIFISRGTEASYKWPAVHVPIMENMLVLPFGRRDFIEQDPNIIFRHSQGGNTSRE